MGSTNKKQTILKGFLLLALGANLSLKPAMRAFDFSSSSELTGAPAPAPAPSDADTAPVTRPPAPAPGAARGPQPDAPQRADVASPGMPHVETPKICGRRFYVTYSELTQNGEVKTKIDVKAHVSGVTDFRAFYYVAHGSLDSNVNDADLKRENDDAVAAAIRKRVPHCPGEGGDPEPQIPVRKEVSREDREKIKSDIAKCLVDSNGLPLSEVKATRCQLSRLNDIDVDDNDRYSIAKAMTQIEQLVRGNLRKSIKNRLLSRDADKIDEGSQLLDETVDQVQSLTRELRLDPSRMSRLVVELQVLRTGGETYRKAADLGDQVRQTKSELTGELRSALQDYAANPKDATTAQHLFDTQREILNRESLLNAQYQMEVSSGAYANLVGANRMGYVSTTEFSQFIQPYTQVRSDLDSLLNQRALMDGLGVKADPSLGALSGMTVGAQMPGDFLAYRASKAAAFKSNFGATIPIRPVTATIGIVPADSTYSGITPMSDQVAPYATFQLNSTIGGGSPILGGSNAAPMNNQYSLGGNHRM